LRTFDFGPDVARHIDRFGSDFVISRLVHSETIHVGCMRLGAGGLVGQHRAVTHQLFAVVEGEGWVRGASSDRVAIRAGQAVFWESGEDHEAGTDTGMVAIVVEGNMLAAGPENIGPVSPRPENAAT
jgi:mannose-6-phosphate isomerase-like protein (cupin superfamily)